MEFVSKMDIKVEDLAPEEMLEKIAQQEYSEKQLKGQIADLRSSLDAADVEIASLLSKNENLRKQMTDMEKLNRKAPKAEAEPSGPLSVEDLSGSRRNEEKICELEKKCNTLKEQNEILTVQLKSLQQEADQNQGSVASGSTVQLTVELDLVEAQLELLCRDEVIEQKNCQIKLLEDHVEECSNIIKDLRLQNQELKMQIEDMQNESYFGMLNDRTGESPCSPSPSLSFAEEIKLLVPPVEVKCSIAYSTGPPREETEREKKPKSHIVAADLHTERCTDSWKTPIPCAKLFLFLSCLILLVFMISGCVFLLSAVWGSWYHILQPSWTVLALPPI